MKRIAWVAMDYAGLTCVVIGGLTFMVGTLLLRQVGK